MKVFETKRSTVTGTSHSPWITHDLPLEIATDDAADARTVGRILVARGPRAAEIAVLLAEDEREVLVNGVPPLAVTVLGEKDEIAAGNRVYLFAAYQNGNYESVADGSREIECSGCTRPIIAGERMARCPACAACFHADPPLNPEDGSRSGPGCRAYDPICKGCRRSFASMSWDPEEIFGAR